MQVVYLTGAPASGKSSLSNALKAQLPEIEVWDYGQRLLSHLNRKGTSVSYPELRRESATRVTPEDVQAVDAELLDWVRLTRISKHAVIDTHAVTHEEYGFRVTAFNASRIQALAPTMIVSLFVSPATTQARIAADSQGRRSVDTFEATMHTMLQSSLVNTYSVIAGVAAYFLNGDRPQDELVGWFRNQLSR